MRNALLLICFFFTSLFAFGQQAKNLTLLSNVTYQSNLNDIWAYVDSSGTEYALVGLVDGVSIVSLANPSSPQVLQNLPGVQTTWRDLKTYQHYAYVTNEGDDGLRIIDLSNLPGQVTYYDTTIAGMTTSHNLYIDDGFCYIVGADIDGGGLTILDLRQNPWRPSKVGDWDTRYVHDVYVRDNIAYVAEINDGLFEIIDVTNKANPTLIGSTTYINAFTHNTWLNDSSTVCFTTDELADAYIYAWDVRNPSNIVELDKIRSSLSNGAATPHNVHVLNDFIFTSYYRDGVNIVDAARPHNLIETGYYDTQPTSGGGTFGCWGAYPFLPSGIGLGTDMDQGLFVFRPNYVRGCYLEGTVTDSVTKAPIQNAMVEILAANADDLTDNAGEYATGVADSGSYNVEYSAFGYFPKTLNNVVLDNGVLVIRDVELAPKARIDMTIRVIERGTGTPIPNAEVQVTETGGNFQNTYATNSNGEASQSQFVQGTYSVIAGRWGWRTREVSYNASGGNALLIIELDKGYYDDYALDFSWNVQSTASRGIWERGEPVGTTFGGGTPFQTDQDVQSDISDQCYVTGNGGGFAGNDDVDGGETTLISPTMDLSTYNDPVLSFYRWFANDGGQGGPIDDTLIVQITDGNQFVTLQKYIGPQNFWFQDTFHLAGRIPLTSNMRVYFITGDYGPGHLVEAAIDVFEVYDGNPLAADNPLADNNVLFQVNPNPVTNASYIQYAVQNPNGNEPLSYTLRDVTGRVIGARDLNGFSGEAPFRFNIPSGVYFLTLRQGDAILSTQRILK